MSNDDENGDWGVPVSCGYLPGPDKKPIYFNRRFARVPIIGELVEFEYEFQGYDNDGRFSIDYKDDLCVEYAKVVQVILFDEAVIAMHMEPEDANTGKSYGDAVAMVYLEEMDLTDSDFPEWAG